MEPKGPAAYISEGLVAIRKISGRDAGISIACQVARGGRAGLQSPVRGESAEPPLATAS